MKKIDILGDIRAALSMPGPQCFATEANGSAAIVVKVATGDAGSFRRPGVVVLFRPELALRDSAAIFRLYSEFHDQPGQPYSMDTFLNPGQPADLALLRLFSQSPTVDFHIFDMTLSYIFTKRIRMNERTRGDLAGMINQALAHNVGLEHLDYAASLAAIKQDRPIW